MVQPTLLISRVRPKHTLLQTSSTILRALKKEPHMQLHQQEPPEAQTGDNARTGAQEDRNQSRDQFNIMLI